ncbi:Crp/Fnr family transcriptional regulator [Bacteroidales bacterium OttesenSCG-928-I21]|nr:Crp/Fnr family transcriptional regulator [Bacteroidales bacterium OttesenSCG-928-I21]
MNKNLKEPVCRYCNLEFKTIFRKLTLEQLEILDTNKTCSFHKKGTVLYEEGHRIAGIYCINNGLVKIYKTGNEGKEQIIGFGKAGNIVGYRSVVNGDLACTSVKMLKDTFLCFIPANLLYRLIKDNVDFAVDLLQIACKELEDSNKYIINMSQKTVKERFSERLLNFKTEFGVDEAGMLNITLTREELANIVGTATESIIRLLSDLKSDKIVELHGRKIKIIDEDALRNNIGLQSN